MFSLLGGGFLTHFFLCSVYENTQDFKIIHFWVSIISLSIFFLENMLLPLLRMEVIDYLSFFRTGHVSQRVCVVSHKAPKSPLCRSRWLVVMVSKFLLWSKALLSGRMKHAMYTTAFPYSYPSLHLGRLAFFWFFCGASFCPKCHMH